MLNKNSISFSDLLIRLDLRMQEEIPGLQSHLTMAPKPVNGARFSNAKRDKARLGGVLILLFEEDGEVKFPLTERPKYDGVHSGQISLPGGKVEPSDENIAHTAKRETQEEIGVPESDIKIIGQLSEIYIPPSNFRVQPVLGYVDAKPDFLSESNEVVTLIETKLSTIMDPTFRKEKQITATQSGQEMFVPYFDVHGHTVWGATAMILSEFADILDTLDLTK